VRGGDADVLVIGAGPAGSASAVTLRRLGRRVTVVDKAVFPREKCCGDGLTTAALRGVERLGLLPDNVTSWQPVTEVAVVSASGRQVDFSLPNGSLYAASAKRADLDAALVDLARSAGADVVEGHGISEIAPGEGLVKVQLDDGRALAAPYVIAADGMWSPTRRLLGLGTDGYLGEWQAGRQYFSNVGPQAEKLWVWFEPDMVPGYAWSFPLPHRTANVGYGVLRPIRGSLRGQQIDWSARQRVVETLGTDARATGPWRAWPIPARIGRSPLQGLGGRVLFVGDAAGACDPMTGEGIAQAIETAEMASEAISAAGPTEPGKASRAYSHRVRSGMALDNGLARILSRVLAAPTGSDRALRLVDSSDWGRRHFVRWMFEDYPRAVLATPKRWHRGMFSSPGAYAETGR
jgi:geranylgeranyl reductase family protein